MAEVVGLCRRSVYLITYSQADIEKVESCTQFSDIVLDSFCRDDNVLRNVLRWVCSKEEHKDQIYRYHMALKFKCQKRWLPIKKHLHQKFGVKVHFSEKHSNYCEAWRYVTKEDYYYILSEGHPDLLNSAVPRTTTAAKVKRENHGVKRKRKIDALEVSEIVLRNKIKSKTELLRLAKKQKEEGKTDLALYVLQHTDKVQKVIDTTWEMEHSGINLERQKIIMAVIVNGLDVLN